MAKLRIDETVNCFIKAVDNAPEDRVESVKSAAASETTSLTSALITMGCKNFANLPTAQNAKNVRDSAILMKRIALTLLVKCGAIADDLSMSLATTINNAAMNAWNNKVYREYTRERHPSEYVWERFVNQGDAVIEMLKTAVAICDNDDKADAVRYSNMIDIETKRCDAAGYSDHPESKWRRVAWLSDSAKAIRNNMIKEWHEAWHKIDSSHVVPNAEIISASTNAKVAAEDAKDEQALGACTCIVLLVFGLVAIACLF